MTRDGTPLVKRLAAEHGIDLANVRGTGVAGRVTVADVRAAAATPTPAAARLAAAHGLDLAGVRGSGAGGRVTAEDVHTARARQARAAAVASRPSLMTRMESPWGYGGTVELDVFGPNPYLEAMRLTDPELYAAAAATGRPVPTLFAAGDLPPFLASAHDPVHLVRLPWVARHAAAAAPSPEAVEIFETCGSGDLTAWRIAEQRFAFSPENDAYLFRLQNWSRTDV